jgi:primosomal protein N' (replication factor Y)
VTGEVLVQTFTPHSPSIQFARHHDFEGFWDQESEYRRNWNYPPFVHLALIQVRSTHQGRAQLSAETLSRRLSEGLPRKSSWASLPPRRSKSRMGNIAFT